LEQSNRCFGDVSQACMAKSQGIHETFRQQRDSSGGCKTIQLKALNAQSNARVILHFLELFSTIHIMSCISLRLIWHHNHSHSPSLIVR